MRSNKKPTTADIVRQTRNRTWGIKPVTQVVPDKKKKVDKKRCRSKVMPDHV